MSTLWPDTFDFSKRTLSSTLLSGKTMVLQVTSYLLELEIEFRDVGSVVHNRLHCYRLRYRRLRYTALRLLITPLSAYCKLRHLWYNPSCRLIIALWFYTKRQQLSCTSEMMSWICHEMKVVVFWKALLYVLTLEFCCLLLSPHELSSWEPVPCRLTQPNLYPSCWTCKKKINTLSSLHEEFQQRK